MQYCTIREDITNNATVLDESDIEKLDYLGMMGD